MKVVRKLINDQKGVFGLTSVQQFFAIILAVGLLAYVIVVIMGTLNTANIIEDSLDTTYNETGASANSTGYTLTKASTYGFSSPSILSAFNGSILIPAANYTVSSAGVLYNGTAATGYGSINVTYSYNYYGTVKVNSKQIVGNVSSGITSFFSNVNPVYAILAILVIILVLVVLVRVVSGGAGQGLNKESSMQL
jgi:hypothetical protein